MARRRSTRVRFAVPFAVAGAIALGAAVPSLSSAAAPPKLANITLAQLIAKAESPQLGAWEGTIRWTAALGLPDLSELGLGGGSAPDFDWTSLTSGTHGLKVWSDGAALRLALIGSSSEVDLYSNTTGTWEYDSVTNVATRLLPDAAPDAAPAAAPTLAGVPSPQSLGREILQNVETWTDAAFAPATTVAGQPAYVVSLTPRPGAPGAATTTLGRCSVAVDAANGAILRVAVYAAGSSSPAFEVGFHSVDFLAPGRHLPASDFAFTPGPGVKMAQRSEQRAAHGVMGGSEPPQVVGTGWGQVVVLRGALSPTATAPHLTKGSHHRIKGVTNQLDEVTTSVEGSWGQGRLLSTSLLNALILPDGDVIAGFVTAPALEAAAASVG